VFVILSLPKDLFAKPLLDLLLVTLHPNTSNGGVISFAFENLDNFGGHKIGLGLL